MTDPTDAPPPPGGSSSSSTSPLAMLSAVVGGLGVALTIASCCTGGSLLCPATLLSGMGLALGILEYRNVQSGASPQENEQMAMIGSGLGGAGCAINGCITLLLGLFLAAYVVFVAVMVVAGNM